VGDLTIANSFASQISVAYSAIAALLPNDVYGTTIQVINLTNNRNMGEIPWYQSFQGGTSSAHSYALGVAAVLRFLTQTRGVQGRKFLGSLAEDVIADDALIDSASLEQIVTFGEYFLVPWNVEGGEVTPIVYNRISKVGRVITGLVASAIPGYQRRRKQGVGI